MKKKVSIGNYLKNKFVQNKGFLLFAVILFSMRWSFADHYRVPTGSMLPTIQIGDHVFVNKMAYDLKFPFTNIVLKNLNEPKRGEIIVFEYPLDPSFNYVKRLIAIPGDRVEIFNGFVKINGKTILTKPGSFESYLGKLFNQRKQFEYLETINDKTFMVQRIPLHSRQEKISFIVPKDKYFFMGDNRDNSADSRYWGFVPRENIMGQVKNVTMSVAFDGIIPKINIFRFGKTLI